jgi:hypothetical protein
MGGVPGESPGKKVGQFPVTERETPSPAFHFHDGRTLTLTGNLKSSRFEEEARYHSSVPLQAKKGKVPQSAARSLATTR